MSAIESLNAALTGRYEIEREAGAGGMATVYLARDLRHDRRVALKVLHPDLAAALGAERFLAEIRTTANLQHPHILPLHDSGEAGGFLFYVMPFVEGETLRLRLAREQQLPLDDALRIARETLSALDYAHRHGVVHRDIKPENILLHDGSALVADFGIALAVTAAGGQRMTQTGLSLGTPQYMSPEQAMGERTVDGRSDIYATGAVLYEMLTGEPPFSGATVQAIVAKVMTERPTPPSTVRGTVPPAVETALLKALAKLPADRFATAAQFADALSSTTPASPKHAYVAPGDRRWRRIAIGTAVAAVGLLVTTVAVSLRPVPPERLEQFEFPIATEQFPLNRFGTDAPFVLSRDGARIAYLKGAGGGTQVWVRDLSSLAPRPVPGTEGALNVALSPDGESVAFTSNGVLKRVPLRGGSALTLVAANAQSPTWADDGHVYFTAPRFSGTESALLRRVAADGGKVDTLARLPGREFSEASPLPGGRGLLVRIYTSAREGRIAVVSLPDNKVHELFDGMRAKYSNTGHIVYVTPDDALNAVPFDVKRFAVTGPPIALDESGTRTPIVTGVSVSETGALLYGVGARRDNEMVWVSRDGHAQSVDTSMHGDVGYPTLSPDGTRVAYHFDQGVWIRNLAQGTAFKLTAEFGNYPAWTSDGLAVSYYTQDSTGFRLALKRADGSAQARLLFTDRLNLVESLWTPDGRSLIIRSAANTAGAGDIYVSRAAADSTPTPILHSAFNDAEPAISPDGQWLAYVANESGRYEVYVVPFPSTASARWSVSTRGGTEPLWSRAGDELFYRDAASNMVSVRVRTTPTFTIGASKVLFPSSSYISFSGHHQYSVSADGRRFLMVRQYGVAQSPRLVLVKNWVTQLQTRNASR